MLLNKVVVMKIKYLNAIVTLMIISGCQKNSVGDKNNGNVLLPNDQVEQASAKICTNGKKLTLISVTDSNRIPIGSNRTAYAVISGSGSCANVTSFEDYNSIDQRIKIDFPIGCISNNSIWTLESITSASNYIIYYYKNIFDDRKIRVNGWYDIKLSYLRDHAGLRALFCE